MAGRRSPMIGRPRLCRKTGPIATEGEVAFLTKRKVSASQPCPRHRKRLRLKPDKESWISGVREIFSGFFIRGRYNSGKEIYGGR